MQRRINVVVLCDIFVPTCFPVPISISSYQSKRHCYRRHFPLGVGIEVDVVIDVRDTNHRIVAGFLFV